MTNEVNVAFIVGTGRCGTSLLGQVLNSHSEICVPPELQLIFEYDGNGNRLFEEFSLCGTKGIDAGALSSIIERCCPHKLELFFDYNAYCHRDRVPRTSLAGFVPDFYESIAKSYGKSWLIEQTPWYGQRLDILTSLFPSAKFIHMIRDGRDVALSFARTPWWYQSVHLNLARWQREIKKISVDAAMYLSNSSYLEVKYENVVSNTEFEVRRICDFLSVDFDVEIIDPQRFIDYDKYLRLDVNKISSKEYGEWKKNKTTSLFSGSVEAWRRNIELFSDGLPTEVSDWLCRYGYDVVGSERDSESQHHPCQDYNLKIYIHSLENDMLVRGQYIEALEQTIADQSTHIRNVEADWTVRGQTIADQSTHIRNVEADWTARGQYIEALVQTISDQANHIRVVEAAVTKFQNSLYGKCISGLSRLLSFVRSK